MSVRLQRLVALSTYGNAVLAGKTDDFDIAEQIAHNCYNMEFIEQPELDIAGSTRLLAPSTEKWFRYLEEDGAKKIKLHFAPSNKVKIPDHISEAFIGGGSECMIEVQFDQYSHLYFHTESPSRKDQFLRSKQEAGHYADSISVEDSTRQLEQVLASLIDFTRNNKFTQNWFAIFTGARSCLTTSDFQITESFIPEHIYSVDSQRLLEAAFRSFAFGGMGSWNDLAFDDVKQETYETLSSELYSSIYTAIATAVNSLV